MWRGACWSTLTQITETQKSVHTLLSFTHTFRRLIFHLLKHTNDTYIFFPSWKPHLYLSVCSEQFTTAVVFKTAFGSVRKFQMFTLIKLINKILTPCNCFFFFYFSLLIFEHNWHLVYFQCKKKIPKPCFSQMCKYTAFLKKSLFQKPLFHFFSQKLHFIFQVFYRY